VVQQTLGALVPRSRVVSADASGVRAAALAERSRSCLVEGEEITEATIVPSWDSVRGSFEPSCSLHA